MGNDAGITFTVTGTDMFGRTQTETITGANAATATGTKYFSTITQIAASGAAAGNVTVNTADEIITGNVTQTGRIESTPLIRGIVVGNVTLQDTSNSFAAIGNFTAGGNLQVNIQNPYFDLTVASTGSVTANTSDKGVTLKANADSSGHSGYTASIQGAVLAGSGGITLGSNYGYVNTSGLGTLTSTGNITI
ncbi:MAG: hypothetical protein J0653_03315, partial [Deltaproteobacteria bacterium]|nr:hypothetical protein [Deltaproteobacteria bacterium]